MALIASPYAVRKRKERKINGDEEFSNRSKSLIFEEENTGNLPLAFRYEGETLMIKKTPSVSQ